jgi:hypothetical protein
MLTVLVHSQLSHNLELFMKGELWSIQFRSPEENIYLFYVLVNVPIFCLKSPLKSVHE